MVGVVGVNIRGGGGSSGGIKGRGGGVKGVGSGGVKGWE